jgi:hypothetical protein
MARPSQFSRTTQAARARKSKAWLLPIPRTSADELSMHYHVALEALRMQQGSDHCVRLLIQLLVLTGFIAEAGHGEISAEQWLTTERALLGAFDRGNETGDWLLDDEAFRLCAVVVTLHDRQLRTASLSVVSEASERMELVQAGNPYDRGVARRTNTPD